MSTKEVKFIPLDYDYVDDPDGLPWVRIFGKTDKNEKICILDTCKPFFYIIPKKKSNIDKFIKLIENLAFENAGRTACIKKIEKIKKFDLGKEVNALKVFISNPKDVQAIKHQIKETVEYDYSREADVNFVTRYITEKKVKPLVWYDVTGEVTTEDPILTIKAKKIKESKKQLEFLPKALAFDIESEEYEIGMGKILMISLVTNGFKKVITFKQLKNPPKEIEVVKNEKELLLKFREYVKKIDPDIITGYFSDGFDFPYLRARFKEHRIPFDLSWDNSSMTLMRGALSSSKFSGLVHIDIFKFISAIIAANLNTETLSLNDVSKELLGEKKVQIKFNPLNFAQEVAKMSQEKLKELCFYNLQDSVLAYKLFEKLWTTMYELSKLVQEPLFPVTRYTLTPLLEHYIMHNLNKFNELVQPRPTRDQIAERRARQKSPGAFVLEPKFGLYENMVVFDFTSMYPTLLISFNIDPSTIKEVTKKDKYDIEIELDGKKKYLYFEKKRKAIFPVLNEEVFYKRKEVKKLLKKKYDPALSARSYILKVLSSASHGYFRFFGSRWQSQECAAALLALASKFIQETIVKVEKEGYKVIYSDSVSGDTNVIIKEKGKIQEKQIQELFKKTDQKSKLGKEYNFRKDIEVLTLNEKGKSVFKPITYIMRHNSDKQMYRVHFTNNWYIDVTEDHSLIAYQSQEFNRSQSVKENPLNRIIEIKPQEIGKKARTVLNLKKIPSISLMGKNYHKKVYEFMGFFIGDGSFMRNKPHKKANKDYYLRLSLGKDGEEIFRKLIIPLKNLGYIKNYWWSKTRKGDLTLNGLKLVKLISQNCRDKLNQKIIPHWLFNEKTENILAFLRGLFSADGCVMIRNNAPIIKYTSIKENYIRIVRKLLYRAGISHSVFKENSLNKYKTKKKVYSSGSYSKNIILKNKEEFMQKIGFLQNRQNKKANIKTKNLQKKAIKNFEFDLQAVKKIEKIKTPKYVYDLEVKSNHRFFANYILVHNTDSIMFVRGKKTKKDIQNLLDNLNKELPGLMELELEDFYTRGLFVSKRTVKTGAKKKYALLSEDHKMKIRGFETIRRDWCKLAKEVQSKVLREILQTGDAHDSLKFVQKIIKDIKNKKIKNEKMIIITQLKKDIDSYAAIGPHVAIAKKMREKGMQVHPGTLLEFIIAEPKTKGKKSLVRERAKLPDEVKEHDYDSDYYINNQILPAVENIFQVFDIESEELKGKKQKKLGDF